MSDLAELFSRDPQGLTKEDLTEIVTQLRRLRHAFNEAAAPAKDPARAKKPAVTQLNLDIEL